MLSRSRRNAISDVGPLHEKESERVPRVMVALEPIDELPGGTERIVLVEENPILRRAIERVLLRLGYQIEAYASSTEALAIMSESFRPVALVLTDCDMPGLTGYQLAQRLWNERPGVRILLSSGRFSDCTWPMEATPGWPPFLPKPYDLQTLAHKVREVIDGPVPDFHPSADTWPPESPAHSVGSHRDREAELGHPNL